MGFSWVSLKSLTSFVWSNYWANIFVKKTWAADQPCLQFKLFKVLFYIADPYVRQDPAFPHRCLSKWSLQELFTNSPLLSISSMAGKRERRTYFLRLTTRFWQLCDLLTYVIEIGKSVARSAGLQVCKSASLQVCKSASLQSPSLQSLSLQSASLQTPSLQVYRFVSLQVCKSLGV